MKPLNAYKRVLLIRPNYKQSHYEYVGLPAGLGYISESLKKGKIAHKVFDMSLGYSNRDLLESISSFNPDLIGISMMSFKYRDHYALADFIKDSFKNIKIVAGGPHISTFRARTLEECISIDYGVALEGEDTILELCSGMKNPEEIKGLLYREGGKVLYSGDRDFKIDLDNIGFPKYEYLEKDKYPRFIPLLTSRGCPYSCIFCPVKVTIGRKLRTRSPSSVVDEIEYWYKKDGMRIFNIVDDNFSFQKQRVLDICADIKKRKLSGLILSCRNGIRADTIDKQTLIAMKEAGFNYLAFGVESGSEKMLSIIKKGEKLSDVEKAISDACGLGYMVTLFFILGLPHETEKDAYESLQLAVKYPVFDIRFYNPIPFPGTELYEWVKQNKYFREKEETYLNHSSHWVNNPVFETPEMSAGLRKKLYNEFNKKAKKHTLKTKLKFSAEMENIFSGIGLPVFISKILARLYYTEIFQKVIVESGIASRLKDVFISPKARKK
ncbi:MAG: radical SAM protein [Candidatus Omnitrophota bacterium]|nr:radical SAM protein [Candidatus Omnitrophota bacterium]